MCGGIDADGKTRYDRATGFRKTPRQTLRDFDTGSGRMASADDRYRGSRRDR
jgi:hypothetical protein